MGNILSGLDLLRRTSEAPVECYGLCFPLLTNAEGVKMGKSVGGAIWLSAGGQFPSTVLKRKGCVHLISIACPNRVMSE